MAALLDKPLTVLENGPEPYRTLVLGDAVWWARFNAARELDPGLTIGEMVRREAATRRPGDGLGNSPQGFPGPSGGHRAAYSRLKERQVERLTRDTKAELAPGDRYARVALLSGARIGESRRRRVTQTQAGPYRRRKSQLWVNPLQWWTNDEMRAYRREHAIPLSDPAAILHRSAECNCGAYIGKDERQDLETFYSDWVDATIRPLEAEARALGIPRCIWGERSDTGRPGARGTALDGVEEDLPMCHDCQLSLDA